jgi:hypothetical protein
MLSTKSSLKTTLEVMSEEFRMPYTFSPKIVKEQLDNLTNSYAKKTGSCYRHDVFVSKFTFLN